MSVSMDILRKQQAWADYCALEYMDPPISPSPNALWNYYIKCNREHPEMKARIPTTNRTTLYNWAREERWVERYAELKKSQTDIANGEFAGVVQNNRKRLVSLQSLAIETLVELAAGAADAKVRLQAAETLLDRSGLTKMAPGAVNNMPVTEKVQEAKPEPPDMSDPAAMAKFLIEQQGNNLNA